MPISLDWLDHRQTILVWELKGHWTMDEFRPMLDRSYDMCLSVSYWVNSIVVDQDTEQFANLLISNNEQRGRPDPKNYDMAVFVVKQNTQAKMLRIMSQSPNRYGKTRVFHSYGDALKFVEQRQVKLQSVPVPK